MWYLHHKYNFTESVLETVLQSLRHSCASELTRQGISLSWSHSFSRGAGLYLIRGAIAFSSAIHLPCSTNNLSQPNWRQVLSLTHPQNDLPKDEVVLTLPGLEPMFVKEGNDAIAKMLEPPYTPTPTITVIYSYHATPEKLLECVEYAHVTMVLDDGKLRQNLNAQRHFRVP